MNKLFDELFNAFGFSNVLNEVEIVGFKYKDKDGVHDVVFNEELWNCSDTSNNNCNCEDNDDTVDTMTIDYVRNYFLRDEMSLRTDNSKTISIDELKDGDYVYMKSDNSAFFGIYNRVEDDVVYFYSTITSDDNEEFVAYNDCCFGVEKWKFYSLKELEVEYVDSVLSEDGWMFDKDRKKFVIVGNR